MHLAAKRATAGTVTLNSNRPGRRINTNPHKELMMQSNITAGTQPATCHREEADNYDRVLVRIGTDWRIIECKDGLQYILQRAAGERRGGARWRCVAYHRTRNTLPEACHRRGAFLDPVRMAEIARLPEICGVSS